MERYKLSIWVLGENLCRSCQKERVIWTFFYFFLFVWFPGDEEFSLSFIVELGSSKLTVVSFHDYFTGIFEPKILSPLVDF